MDGPAPQGPQVGGPSSASALSLQSQALHLPASSPPTSPVGEHLSKCCANARPPKDNDQIKELNLIPLGRGWGRHWSTFRAGRSWTLTKACQEGRSRQSGAEQPTWSPSGGLMVGGQRAGRGKTQEPQSQRPWAQRAHTPRAHDRAGEAWFPPTRTGRRQEGGLWCLQGEEAGEDSLRTRGGGGVIPNFPNRAFPAIRSTHLPLFSGLQFHFQTGPEKQINTNMQGSKQQPFLFVLGATPSARGSLWALSSAIIPRRG